MAKRLPTARHRGRGSQSLRQLDVLRYLAQEGTWCTCAELQEHTGSGYRTIYRDVEQLRELGLPIDHDGAASGRGWRLRKTHLLRWLFEKEKR